MISALVSDITWLKPKPYGVNIGRGEIYSTHEVVI